MAGPQCLASEAFAWSPTWTRAALVGLGVVFAALAARGQPRVAGLSAGQTSGLRWMAVGGAVVGAFALQLPADLAGWSAPPADAGDADGVSLGGRTVLGGLLGGWLAVEAGKRAIGFRGATGDAFALPLAIALCVGRLGCHVAGCCQGVVCEPHWYAVTSAGGAHRLPVQAIEALFHGVAAAALWWAGRRGWQTGRRLALYVAGYAALRFGLEELRPHPEILDSGLSYYQLLAICLFALAAGTWLRRSAGRAHSSRGGSTDVPAESP